MSNNGSLIGKNLIFNPNNTTLKYKYNHTFLITNLGVSTVSMEILIAVFGGLFTILSGIIVFIFKNQTTKLEKLQDRVISLESTNHLNEESVRTILDDKLSSLLISNAKLENVIERLSDRVNQLSIVTAVLESEVQNSKQSNSENG